MERPSGYQFTERPLIQLSPEANKRLLAVTSAATLLLSGVLVMRGEPVAALVGTWVAMGIGAMLRVNNT
jgi:hypothetical protein